jgi:tRNA G18 (ribose-2'-O)-methylase SpoU
MQTFLIKYLQSEPKNTSEWSSTMIKYALSQMQGLFNIHKTVNIIHDINKLKEEKKYTIISLDIEKTSDKIQHPFM